MWKSTRLNYKSKSWFFMPCTVKGIRSRALLLDVHCCCQCVLNHLKWPLTGQMSNLPVIRRILKSRSSGMSTYCGSRSNQLKLSSQTSVFPWMCVRWQPEQKASSLEKRLLFWQHTCGSPSLPLELISPDMVFCTGLAGGEKKCSEGLNGCAGNSVL